ncbi:MULTISPECIES: hypothetical protein [unclassified Apibacter]|uniref:hypothetical protein n=1 Tax=unclassified Apibacter TaxID=2630820 RepID=UPI00135E2A96|nr:MULTISPECIES: hypothetical protein [unclassified Apibacter]MXP04783.1 hypothetical protein [Apibacter sp. B3546]MXP13130.1 hypothetical protein [Apibacter sp. B3239]
MYRINRLQRNVLITADEVMFHAPIDGNVSERNIIQNIILAEERFVSSAISSTFYLDFVNKKNKVVTESNQEDLLNKINDSNKGYGIERIEKTDIPVGTIINAIEFVENKDYVELWNMYLWKYTAECVDFLCTIPTWIRHTNQGQMLNSPKVIGSGTESGSADVKEIKFKLDSMLLDRLNPFKERMHEWICRRIEKFPLYTNECACFDIKDKPVKSHKSDIILGVYP